MGIANTLEDGVDIKDVRKDTSKDSRHIRPILELNEFLKSQKQSKLKYESKYYPDDNHGSVQTIATYDGLRFIFDKYRFKYSSKDLMDSKIDLANKFEKHYKGISEYFGFNVYPPENFTK